MLEFLASYSASSAAFSIAPARVRVAWVPLFSGRITPTRTGIWLESRLGRVRNEGKLLVKGWPATGGGGKTRAGGGGGGLGAGAVQPAMPEANAMAQIRYEKARRRIK